MTAIARHPKYTTHHGCSSPAQARVLRTPHKSTNSVYAPPADSMSQDNVSATIHHTCVRPSHRCAEIDNGVAHLFCICKRHVTLLIKSKGRRKILYLCSQVCSGSLFKLLFHVFPAPAGFYAQRHQLNQIRRQKFVACGLDPSYLTIMFVPALTSLLSTRAKYVAFICSYTTSKSTGISGRRMQSASAPTPPRRTEIVPHICQKLPITIIRLWL